MQTNTKKEEKKKVNMQVGDVTRYTADSTMEINAE